MRLALTPCCAGKAEQQVIQQDKGPCSLLDKYQRPSLSFSVRTIPTRQYSASWFVVHGTAVLAGSWQLFACTMTLQEHRELRNIYACGTPQLLQALMRVAQHHLRQRSSQAAVASVNEAVALLPHVRDTPAVHAAAQQLCGSCLAQAARLSGGTTTLHLLLSALHGFLMQRLASCLTCDMSLARHAASAQSDLHHVVWQAPQLKVTGLLQGLPQTLLLWTTSQQPSALQPQMRQAQHYR